MPTKKIAKTEAPKPKKTVAKKAAIKEKAEPKPKAVKKVKAVEPEAAIAPSMEAAPKKKAAKAAPDQGLGLTPHAEAILAAIREGRAVEFIFEDADANAPRTFEPRQLTYDALAEAWFAWGWDRRYNAERFHRLDLLKEVNAVDGVGRSAQGPYKDGTPGNLIGGWLGGDPIPVKVMLHKQWVFAVKQAPPAFPDFKLEEKEEGKALASFTATDLRAIARWVMQFGDGVTVMEPARLQDRIRQAALAWGAKLPAAPQQAPRPEPRHENKPHEQRHHEPRHHEPRHSDEPRRREHGREHHEDRTPKQNQNQQVEIRLERL